MPAYVFACDKCGEFEVIRPMKEAADPQDCPSCLSPARRVYTVTAHKVSFRDGWNMSEGRYFNTQRQFKTYLDKIGAGVK